MITTRMLIRVRYADTDKMQVAHHARYFEWYECSRTEMLREINYPYDKLEKDGCMLPIIETNCRFIQPAVYDDVLEITTILARLPRSTIKLKYLIRRKSDDVLLAEAHTVHAFVNKGGRAIKPPKNFLDLLQAYFKKEEMKHAG